MSKLDFSCVKILMEKKFCLNLLRQQLKMVYVTLPWTCRHSKGYIYLAFGRILKMQASSIVCVHTYPNCTSFCSAGDRQFFGSLCELINHMLYMRGNPSIQLFSLVIGYKEMSLYRYDGKSFERTKYEVVGQLGRHPGIRELLRTPLNRFEKRIAKCLLQGREEKKSSQFS